MMKAPAIVAIVLTAGGLTAMVNSFLTSASPYVSLAEARTTHGSNLHLAGDIVAGTVFHDAVRGEVRFRLRDENGDEVRVVYDGAPPSNMGSATKVVAVGELEQGDFKAHRLLLKCPSKYESETGSQA